MKKSIVALSAIAAMSMSAFGAKLTHNDLQAQIEALKAQLSALESKINEQKIVTAQPAADTEKRLAKIEKKLNKNSKKINKVKAHDAGDNIKWNVDFRTSVDNLTYKHASGKESENDALMTNRLWLGMKFKADENSSFYGTLSYLKAFGDTANHSQSNTNPGYADFDWLTNENALDNTLNVKEAYWLYTNDSFLGNNDISWTASVGRRPSTDGLGINFSADQQRKSPLSHTVNVEFDGASARFNLDKVTGVEGMWFKFCAGRGLTNAKPRFQNDGADYANDDSKNPDIDMAGFIFVPYDNGQYSVHMNYARAWNLIGFSGSAIQGYQAAYGAYAAAPSATTAYNLSAATPAFNDVGDMDLATVMFKAEGLGNGISDFLDNTTVFASYAMSKTRPNSVGMLGTTDSKQGDSFWLGINMPDGFTDDGRFGIEWNKGSKYWRSMTYGEDTMAGSKIATRGTAWEVYYHKSLTKALSASLSYTQIDYDYTGSNSFFGAEGTPNDLSLINGTNAALYGDPVKEATNIMGYIRYRY